MGLIRSLVGIASYGGATLFGLVTLSVPFGEETAGDKLGIFIVGLTLTYGLSRLGKWSFKKPENAIAYTPPAGTIKQTKDEIQETFYRVLRANNGNITVMRLAMDAGLSGKEAQAYLDEKAKEFNANYDVNEKGDIVYRFPL